MTIKINSAAMGSSLLFLLGLTVGSAWADNIIRTAAPITIAPTSPLNEWAPGETVYSSWQNHGSLYDCTYLPGVESIPQGQEFTQTADNCLQEQIRTVQLTEVSTVSGESRNKGEPFSEYQVLGNQPSSRIAVGTQPFTGIGPYKHFRLNFQKNQSEGYVRVVELEFLNADGEDLFDQHSVTARSSSNYGVAYDAYEAIDNNHEQRWTSDGNGAPAWISYSFPDNVDVNAFSIRDYPSSAGSYQQPKDFTFEVSVDGQNWSVVKAYKDVTNWVPGQVIVFDFN